MKKYVKVELYCGDNDFLDEVCLTFDEDASEEIINETVDKEFGNFIDDMIEEAMLEECPEFDDDIVILKNDIAATCSVSWQYINDDTTEEEHEYDWRNRE